MEKGKQHKYISLEQFLACSLRIFNFYICIILAVTEKEMPFKFFILNGYTWHHVDDILHVYKTESIIFSKSNEKKRKRAKSLNAFRACNPP